MPHLALANFYWAAGRRAETQDALRNAVAQEPKNVLARRAMATFYLATNQPAEAEPHLKAIFDLTHASAAALALADFYVSRNDAAAARAALESIKDSESSRFVAEA